MIGAPLMPRVRDDAEDDAKGRDDTKNNAGYTGGEGEHFRG